MTMFSIIRNIRGLTIAPVYKPDMLTIKNRHHIRLESNDVVLITNKRKILCDI